jgi:hypothetical protein
MDTDTELRRKLIFDFCREKIGEGVMSNGKVGQLIGKIKVYFDTAQGLKFIFEENHSGFSSPLPENIKNNRMKRLKSLNSLNKERGIDPNTNRSPEDIRENVLKAQQILRDNSNEVQEFISSGNFSDVNRNPTSDALTPQENRFISCSFEQSEGDLRIRRMGRSEWARNPMGKYLRSPDHFSFNISPGDTFTFPMGTTKEMEKMETQINDLCDQLKKINSLGENRM